MQPPPSLFSLCAGACCAWGGSKWPGLRLVPARGLCNAAVTLCPSIPGGKGQSFVPRLLLSEQFFQARERQLPCSVSVLWGHQGHCQPAASHGHQDWAGGSVKDMWLPTTRSTTAFKYLQAQENRGGGRWGGFFLSKASQGAVGVARETSTTLGCNPVSAAHPWDGEHWVVSPINSLEKPNSLKIKYFFF